MRNEVSSNKIDAELESIIKPIALVAGLDAFPYSSLDDREFEILVYSLIKDEIQQGNNPGIVKISLMNGVSERGRDIVLYSSYGPAGIVQCKNLIKKLDKPTACKELIKFALHCILDDTLLSDAQQAEYHMYASGGFAEPAQKLFDEHITVIDADMASGEFKKYVQQVVEFYEHFCDLRAAPPVSKVAEMIKSFRLLKFDANDLNLRLSDNPRVTPPFFRTKILVNSEHIRPLMRSELDSFGERHGLSLLTDEHLAELTSRISNIDKSKRVSLGQVDIFGYDRAIYGYLSELEFSQFLVKISGVRNFLMAASSTMITKKTSELLYELITVPFLHTGKVHPFTMSVTGQYVVRAIIPVFAKGTLSPDKFESTYEAQRLSLEEVVEHNIESVMLFLKGDYRRFPKIDPDREKRIEIYQSLSSNIVCPADAWAIIHKDMKLISGVIEEIINIVCGLVDEVRTIVIKDVTVLGDPKAMEKINKELNDLNIGKASQQPWFTSEP